MPKFTWQQLSNLTPDNGAVQSLRDLIVAEVFTDPELERFFTTMYDVHNGDKLDFSGEMKPVGWAGGGCEPRYKNMSIDFGEKQWAIGSWEIPLKLCFKELEGTIAEYCLKTGTDIADLTSSEYMDEIVYPKLKAAMIQMMWRLIWFGNTEANLHSSDGVLKTGTDIELYKACDGLWKHLFALGTASAGQHTTIEANSQTTYALQKSKIKEKGAAIKVFDDILENADARIEDLPGAGIFATKSLCDALENDLKNTYTQQLTWEQIFGGIKVTEYNGALVYRINTWDRYIHLEDNGTKYNLPHRAVFTAPSQLLVGTPSKEIISELDVFFDKTTRLNHIYSTGKIGTLLGQDALFQVAY